MNMDIAPKNIALRAHWRGVAVVAGLLFTSCIERSNPFDPLNARGRVAEVVRADNQAKLDAFVTQLKPYAAYIEEYLAGFNGIKTANGETLQINESIRIGNQATVDSNIAVESWNNALPESLYVQLRSKSRFVLLAELAGFGPTPGFEERRAGLKALASEISGFMAEVNSRNSPVDVYPQSYRDSIFRPFARDTLAFAGLAASVDSGNAAVHSANADIRQYNGQRRNENTDIDFYNGNIEFLRESRGGKVIVSADSLNSATKVAKAGDTLFLGPGTYDANIRFDIIANSGTEGNPIVVRGHPSKTSVIRGLGTNLNASALVISSQSHIRFEDLVFRKGGTNGVKLENGAGNIEFRRCVFDSSGTWGLEALDSYFRLDDCVVRNNGGGIRATGVLGEDPALRLTMVNTLIVQNRGRGLEAITVGGFIENCTFSGNAGEGIYIRSPAQPLNIRNSIVSSNLIAGIWREPTTWVPGSLTVLYSDVWGNDPVDWNLSGITPEQATEIMAGNYNIFPEFVDPAGFDYSLRPGSELAEYEINPPFLKIGYRP